MDCRQPPQVPKEGLAVIFRLVSLSLILCFFWGCAPNKIVFKETSSNSPAHQPVPPLTTDQLFGLRNPHGMISDPESGQYALREVMENYLSLKEKASQNGWHLILVSGYRTFYSQRRIWNNYDKSYENMKSLSEKARVRAIMSVVSVPGLSRHHWGTDLDISEETLRGQLVKIQPDTPKKVIQFYQWMEQNAPQFGFCKVYLGDRGAVVDEPWHWSYFPFSRVYAGQILEIRNFSKIMDIKVARVNYLMKNFPFILKKETQSTNIECLADGKN